MQGNQPGADCSFEISDQRHRVGAAGGCYQTSEASRWVVNEDVAVFLVFFHSQEQEVEGLFESHQQRSVNGRQYEEEKDSGEYIKQGEYRFWAYDIIDEQFIDRDR